MNIVFNVFLGDTLCVVITLTMLCVSVSIIYYMLLFYNVFVILI